MGLSRAAFGKRFEGSGGKAVTIGVGVSLALGLSAAEAKFGFNLGSFGVFALGIIVVAFGLLFFYLLSALGAHKSTAAALSFLIAYSFLNSISGKLTLMIQKKFPILNLLFLASLVFVIIRGVSFLGVGSKLKTSGKNMLRKGSEYARHIPLREEKLERKTQRREAKGISRERKTSSRMLKQLQEIRELIKEHGGSEKGRKAIVEQIESLSTGENKLVQKLAHLKELDKQLEELDILAVRKLKEEQSEVPDELRAEIEKEIRAEKDKHGLSRKMEGYESRIKASVDGFNRAMLSCIERLGENRIAEALQAVDEAISCQKRIEGLLAEMERTGRIMKGLTKREYKSMKRTKKAA